MNYRQYQPSEPAARFVACYWTLEETPGAVRAVQRIVPDGCPEMILNLGEPFESFQDQVWEPQPARFFAGQLTGPMFVRPCGAATIIGVRFHPDGASRAFGIPLGELTDTVVALDELAPALARELKRIESTQQIAALDEIFASLNGPADRVVSASLAAIMRASGAIDIEDVAAHAGLSRRQLERRFTAQVGMPPKLFCRIRRFQRVFQAIEGSRARWADTAIECGYYDQAHLIRDFRDFAGEPPVALLCADTDLATHFLISPAC